MSKIYQTENPTIGDLEKGDHVRFPGGDVYECLGKRRAKKALGGEALVFRRIQKLSARMYSKPLHRLPDPDGRARFEWRLDDGA